MVLIGKVMIYQWKGGGGPPLNVASNQWGYDRVIQCVSPQKEVGLYNPFFSRCKLNLHTDVAIY